MKDNIIKIDQIINKPTVSMKKAAEFLGLTYSTARRRILDKANNIGIIDYGGGVVKVILEDLQTYKAACYRKGGISAQ